MLENLKLKRVVVHEVLTAADLRKRKPNHSVETIELDDDGKELICERLVASIGSDSHSEEMLVSNSGNDVPFQLIAKLLEEKDKGYISTTAGLADRLSDAQTMGSIKAGLGVFLQGIGDKEGETLRWIAIIKADPDRGFVKEIVGKKISLRFVADLVMGAQQRMLKVAFFVEDVRESKDTSHRDSSDFTIKVYDHLLSNSGRGTSALYFYASFLGLKPAENSAKVCRDFYEKTRELTDELSNDDEEKLTYRSHLVSYLRSEKDQISAKEFADTYLPQRHRLAYMRKMKAAKFPDHAVRKDIRLIKTRLKKQSLKFTSKIVIAGSSEAIQKSVVLGQIVQLNEEDWTEVKIKGRLE